MLTITSINIYFIDISDQQIIRLQKLQNKAMRAILKANRLTSTRSMLDTLKWLNIKEWLQVSTIYFIRKMKIGHVPEYLTEQLRYVGEVQNHPIWGTSWTSEFNKQTPQQSKYWYFIKD